MVANKIAAWIIRIIMAWAVASITVLLITLAADKSTGLTFSVLAYPICVLGLYGVTLIFRIPDEQLVINNKTTVIKVKE